MNGTRLRDVAARKALMESGKQSLDGSSDPMIALARLVDPIARSMATWHLMLRSRATSAMIKPDVSASAFASTTRSGSTIALLPSAYRSIFPLSSWNCSW